MKTADYIRKANNKYNSKFDIIQVKLDKGTKEQIKAITNESYNEYVKRLIMTDLMRLKGIYESAESENVSAIIPEPPEENDTFKAYLKHLSENKAELSRKDDNKEDEN